MTKEQSSLFRFLLFLAGAGILVLAFFITTGDRELTRIDAFVWISIGLMYLVFFLPFFFSSFNIGNFSGKIPTLPMVWIGIIIYLAASVFIILLLTIRIISLNVAILIQAILFFLFLLDVYFAYFASSHVRSVAVEEAIKQQYLNQLKPKAQVLLLLVNKLPSQYEKARNVLNQTLEDIKFIYPVNNGAGDDLEKRIIGSINNIQEMCSGLQSGANPAGLDSEAENLRMLVKERKLLRN